MRGRNLIPEVERMVQRLFSLKFLESQGLVAHNLLQYKTPAVAFSGGKDSLVVLVLAMTLKPNIIVVFNNTGVEAPETVQYIHWLVREWKLNFIETHPVRTFWQCADHYGSPGGSKVAVISRKAACCYWLKEKPMRLAIREHRIDCYFSGNTASESFNRMMWAKHRGTCFYNIGDKCQKIYPILWWTVEEVWEYIHALNLPYNELYDKGRERIGCITCTAFRSWEDEMSRFYPKLYRIIKSRGG